jgi:hypothetical protein
MVALGVLSTGIAYVLNYRLIQDEQPSEVLAEVGWRLIEYLFDGASALAGSGSSLVVEGDGGPGRTRRHSSTASWALML